MASASTSRRFPAPRRVRGLRVVVLLLAGAIGATLAPWPAQAAPAAGEPTTASEAAALVAARARDLEAVTEQFDAARDQLYAQQAAATAAAATFQKAQAELATAQAHVRGIARSAFTGSDLNAFQALLTSKSASEFIDRVATIQMVAGHQSQVLGQAAQAGTAAAQAQAAAAKAAADAKARFDAVAAQQNKLQAQIADFKAKFAQLSAQEQRVAVTAAGSGGDLRASRADRPAAVPALGPVSAPSQAAAIAVSTALAQRGKPYVWAAAGPGSFDCSGLVLYAYRAAGIALPHSSAMQVRMGHAVSRAALQPGDLVGYYRPVSHIGIYVGNGMVINAPTFGDVVKVVPIDYPGPVTALTRLVG